MIQTRMPSVKGHTAILNLQGFDVRGRCYLKKTRLVQLRLSHPWGFVGSNPTPRALVV